MPNDLPDWQRASQAPLRIADVLVAPNATGTVTASIPFGCLAIGYLVDSAGGVASPSQVQVNGNLSLQNYLTDFDPSGLHVAMLAGIDTSATLQVITGLLTSSHVFLMVWTSQAVVGQHPSTKPTTWQVPTEIPLRIAILIAAGATTTILASRGTFRIFEFWLGIEGAAAGTPEITVVAAAGGSGNSYHAFEFAAAPVPPWHPGGVAITRLDGIALNNQDTAGHVVRGSLSYSAE